MSSALYNHLSSRCSKAADTAQLHSPPLIQTPAVHRDKRGCLTAWSAWTTAPTATWPDRWSVSWTVWATGPGWTGASVAPLRLSPELSAPSTTPNPFSRAPWTAYTNWNHTGHSQRSHHPLTKAWWRNKEAAAHLSKVGTLVQPSTTSYFCSNGHLYGMMVKYGIFVILQQNNGNVCFSVSTVCNLLYLSKISVDGLIVLSIWVFNGRLLIWYFISTQDQINTPSAWRVVRNSVDITHIVHCILSVGLWGTTLTENTSNNRELFVRTTLRELLVYLVFLVDICLCKCST